MAEDEMPIDTPAIGEGQELDDEIDALQAKILLLRQQRALQTSTLLSSKASDNILRKLRAPPTKRALARDANPLHTSILDTAKAQSTHNQANLYRIGAGITTFTIRDPDPNAVDNGRVMGMRIEAFQSGKYVRPYYIFLNKPYTNGNEGVWRVHRHTVPPCIPLAALAAKHLPTPEKGPDGELLLAKKKQDLPKFMRALRTEIARYHARSSAISALRKQVSGDKSGSGIADVSPADAEAKMIRIEWMDGRVGRIVVDDRGRVKKAVVIAEEGRDGEMESLLLGGDARLEGLVERLVD